MTSDDARQIIELLSEIKRGLQISQSMIVAVLLWQTCERIFWSHNK